MRLEPGKAYKIRLTSGAWVSAVFLSEDTQVTRRLPRIAAPTRYIRARTRYSFRNIGTGRTITLKSLRKVREIEGGAL